jgi:hypothetical protein
MTFADVAPFEEEEDLVDVAGHVDIAPEEVRLLVIDVRSPQRLLNDLPVERRWGANTRSVERRGLLTRR